jgi:uncharacterized spore protein YtfJ
MDNAINDIMESVHKESEARSQMLQRLLAGADSSTVFGPPVSSGGFTVIPVAEVASGGGFGSGLGFGTPRMRGERTAGQMGGPESSGGQGTGVFDATVQVGGGGGGGGGGSLGRPVAVIVLKPDGVEVKPVLDVTKLVITALGALGARQPSRCAARQK